MPVITESIADWQRDFATIARELVESERANTIIDWTIKESVRAKLRMIVNRIFGKCGHPAC